MRRLAVAAAALTLVGVAAPARAGGGDTTAIAINTKDGFDLFKLAFQIRRATGDVVDNGNGAVAYASCTDCQTIALAIQIVLISGTDASTVSPENVAIAINEGCVLCDTLASAYQFVVTADGHLNFTPEGRRRLAALRQELLALRSAGLTGPEIQAKVDALMTELADILSTELVVKEKDKSPSPSPTAEPPSEIASAPPTESPSPTPSPSDATGESPTAEPTATATP
jgi:putative peptide zinc metalloprotease protein